MSEAVAMFNLTRDYKREGGREPLRALSDFSLSISRGDIHGLLGPNGAGKTTLTKILSTALLPSSGHAVVAGLDVLKDFVELRRKISVVFGGERGLFNHLTGKENLLFWAALYDIPSKTAYGRAMSLLDEAGLIDRANDRVSEYSRGLKQRLHLARGLISDPEVIFLDEPTAGMDPIAAKSFQMSISKLAKNGRTVLLTTHDMKEASNICHRVSFINKGKLLATCTPDRVGEIFSNQICIDFISFAPEVAVSLAHRLDVTEVIAIPDQAGHYKAVLADNSCLSGVVSCLLDEGVTYFSAREPTLEEAYFHLIGKNANL